MKSMKKIFTVALTAAMSLTLVACGKTATENTSSSSTTSTKAAASSSSASSSSAKASSAAASSSAEAVKTEKAKATAKAAEDKITAATKDKTVDTYDRAAVAEAKATYDALTPEEKTYVPAQVVNDLNKAEADIIAKSEAEAKAAEEAAAKAKAEAQAAEQAAQQQQAKAKAEQSKQEVSEPDPEPTPEPAPQETPQQEQPSSGGRIDPNTGRAEGDVIVLPSGDTVTEVYREETGKVFPLITWSDGFSAYGNGFVNTTITQDPDFGTMHWAQNKNGHWVQFDDTSNLSYMNAKSSPNNQ